MQTSWQANEIDTLTQMWAQGDTSRVIATALNKSPGAVTAKARRLGLPRRLNPASQIANFAEHLSEYGSVEAAGKSVGVSFSRAKDMFDRICSDLGPQAR